MRLLKSMPGTIQIVDYDPSWPRIFLQLKNRIWPSVSGLAMAIEHVGSTSIPGMAAKPVIDMDVVIASSAVLPSIVLRLAGLDYQHRGDLGVEDREAFRTPEDQPAHHLYVCSQNSIALRNHIAIRDYLRTHQAEAEAYSTLKKELAGRFRNERLRYNEAKTDFVLSILKRCEFSGEELDSIERVNRK